MSNYKEEIEKMVWSYSRLTSFEHCPYEFYLNYIVKNDEEYLSEGNFYGESGNFVHDILAKIFTKELTPEEAALYFVENFDDNVFYKVRESTMNKSFESCAEYFGSADFEWINDYEILGVEQKFEFTLKKNNFIGFIDLLLRDKKDNKIVIMDHKSSSYPFKVNGKDLKANAADNFNKYKKQMYLYSHWVKEAYGEFPEELIWNHFKDGGKLAKFTFNEDEYNETIKWALDIIKKIKKENNFRAISEDEESAKKEWNYCHVLCGFRHSCEYIE